MGPVSTRRDPWPIVGIACAIGFLVLAALVVRRGGLGFDEPLASAIRALPIPVAFWEACTWLGGPALIPVAVALTLGTLLSGRARLAIAAAAVLLVAALFTDAVKDFVARPRPPDPLVATSGYSFPSGHTLNGTVTYGLVALVAWRARHTRSVRGGAVVVGVAIPVVVGLSRIALGAHWPTDVLGGWLAGAALVAIAATLVSRTGAMTPDLPWPGARPGGSRREPPRDDRPTYSRAATVAGAAPTSRARPAPQRRRRGRARRG